MSALIAAFVAWRDRRRERVAASAYAGRHRVRPVEPAHLSTSEGTA